MIIAITIIVSFLLILIPIILSINKTNEGVLSLFGRINLGDIQFFVVKCQYYKYFYLVERNCEEKILNII